MYERTNTTTQITVVNGWQLETSTEDGEPRVRDAELARHLGYDRHRKIRDLIESMVVAGKLPGVVIRPGGGRIPGTRGRLPSKEYWLSEVQALKVVAKSETPKADAILDEVIHVFVAVRRGLVQQPARDDHALLARLEERFLGPLQAMRADLELLRAEAQLAHVSSFCTPREVQLIQSRIVRAGHRRAALRGGTAKSHIESIRHFVLGEAGHLGPGRTYATMSPDQFRTAERLLQFIESDLDAAGSPQRELVYAAPN